MIWAMAFALLLLSLLVYGIRHMDDEQPNADLLAEAFDVVRSETPIFDRLWLEQYADDFAAWDHEVSS